jgi:hypothetical protein
MRHLIHNVFSSVRVRAAPEPLCDTGADCVFGAGVLTAAIAGYRPGKTPFAWPDFSEFP